jgi:hypothetical protein
MRNEGEGGGKGDRILRPIEGSYIFILYNHSLLVSAMNSIHVLLFSGMPSV